MLAWPFLVPLPLPAVLPAVRLPNASVNMSLMVLPRVPLQVPSMMAQSLSFLVNAQER